MQFTQEDIDAAVAAVLKDLMLKASAQKGQVQGTQVLSVPACQREDTQGSPTTPRPAKGKKDLTFNRFDGTNPFPRLLFPPLVACMKRHQASESSPHDYEVHVSVHERIVPDTLLEICSLSEDYLRTKILGSIFRDHMSWIDDYDSDDGMYDPSDDPDVITDVVRGLRFAATGWFDQHRRSPTEGSLSVALGVEMVDGRYLKDGARATDILFGLWVLLPKHLEQEHMFELEIVIPTWQKARSILFNYFGIKQWDVNLLFETTKVYDRDQVK
ncbi:hypothetical protein NCC49_004611 [Naganishia albida]|nr:hypothetical protein NCC49_004611 [Naganishia albida]